MGGSSGLCWFLVVFLTSMELPGAEQSPSKRFLFDKANAKAPVVIKQPTYTAAVYNHAVVSPPRVTSRKEALAAMDKNLDIYEQQASRAKSQGADIIVFPEDGIYGPSFSRDTILPFLETIPNPKSVIWNPCAEKNRYDSTEVQQRLSCMAKNNSMYIVANMGDKQVCSRSNDSMCVDGRYQYNTNVVFDPNGTLIARYHKRNLFFESQFNYPQTELVTFDTPFGRFATFTCFDSLFHDPAVSVIERYNVDSVAFPTLWSETPPFLTAIQWQAAFAVGMKVNFLAANHYFAGGSGIYTPTGSVKVADKSQPGKLLVATIPSRSKPFPAQQNQPPVGTTSSPGLYPTIVFGDHYNFVDLKEGRSSARVCSGTFCCQANYTLTKRNHEIFALGAFSGTHRQIQQAGLQMCVLMRCISFGPARCGRTPLQATSTFHHLVMSGSFTTKYVFPEILVNSDSKAVLPGNEWQYSNYVLTSERGFSKPLLSAVLLGRLYSLDVD